MENGLSGLEKSKIGRVLSLGSSHTRLLAKVFPLGDARGFLVKLFSNSAFRNLDTSVR